MERGRTTPCPDPESLAAWIDQGLEAAAAAAVEAHVAGCDDCRTVLAGVLKAQHAVPELAAAAPAPAPVVAVRPARPTRVWWGAAGALATAASLLLVFVVPSDRRPAWLGGSESKLAGLAAAVGEQRTVEGRLSGGFRYRPLRAPVRSGGSTMASTDNWSLLAAAGEIREVAKADPSPENLHALGVASLLLGEHDNAVSALEEAAAARAGEAAVRADLSAAYLARARAADRPDDLARALAAAERALAADAGSLEALFNRALTLEALYLTEQAREAWRAYLERDAASRWAGEARQRLADLERAAPESGMARNNSPPADAPSAEAALQWLLHIGLPDWAGAVLAGDDSRARQLHHALSRYATDLAASSGDPYPQVLVASLAPEAESRPARARALVRLGEAYQRLAADDAGGARAAFLAARETAAEPEAAVIDLEIGMTHVLARRDDEAARIARARVGSAQAAGHRYVEGRAHRLEGYRRLFQGDYAGALDAYRQAAHVFIQGRYLGQAASVAVQVAENLGVVGRPEESWRWRHRSLEMAARAADPRASFTVRIAVTGMLERERDFRVGRVFAESIGLPSPDDLSPLQRVLREQYRTRAALALGDLPAARAALQTARALLDRSDDFRAPRIRADVLVLAARAEASADRAERLLTDALGLMGPERTLHRAGSLLMRASIRARRGRVEGARADVSETLALLAERPAAPNEPLRLDDAPAAFRALASVVASDASLQRDAAGLHLVEQLREVLDGVPSALRLPTVAALEQRLDALADDEAVVFFLFDEAGAMLRWAATRHEVSFTRRPLATADVAARVGQLAAQVARAGEAPGPWRDLLAGLHDDLWRDLPPAVARARRVLVVPDGALHRVPFGALFDREAGRHLFEDTAVRVAPNLAFGLSPSSRPASASAPRALVIGEPALLGPAARRFDRLPRARAEAAAVAGLYADATLLVGADARRSDVLEALGGADVLHFAGHAVEPLAGGSVPQLLLAGPVDDPAAGLRASDLPPRAGRPLRVVLAACETGDTAFERAGGAATLAAGFLRAGASSVVGTLWAIDDGGSESFFVEVHRALLAGRGAAEAVAEAQRACHTGDTCRASAAVWIGTTAYGGS